MNALKSLISTMIPNNVLIAYLDIYRSVGKNEQYEELFKDNLKSLSASLVDKETYFFLKTFFPSIRLADSKISNLLSGNVKPKLKDEYLVANIQKTFRQIHNSLGTFEINPNEIINLQEFLFDHYYPKDQLGIKVTRKSKSSIHNVDIQNKRLELDDLINEYMRLKKTNNYEINLLNLSFMVDFLNMEIFSVGNDKLAILIFYCLALQSDIECFRYVSYFEKLFKVQDAYLKAVNQTTFNWSDGFPQVLPLFRINQDIFISGYQELKEYARDYEYELGQKKTDYIENTINKLGDIFTKSEIKKKHPLVSESTINRTLQRLRDEEKIKPLGTGRNTKWIKLYSTETKFDFSKSQGSLILK